jgi:hypothetical protein
MFVQFGIKICYIKDMKYYENRSKNTKKNLIVKAPQKINRI